MTESGGIVFAIRAPKAFLEQVKQVIDDQEDSYTYDITPSAIDPEYFELEGRFYLDALSDAEETSNPLAALLKDEKDCLAFLGTVHSEYDTNCDAMRILGYLGKTQKWSGYAMLYNDEEWTEALDFFRLLKAAQIGGRNSEPVSYDPKKQLSHWFKPMNSLKSLPTAAFKVKAPGKPRGYAVDSSGNGIIPAGTTVIRNGAFKENDAIVSIVIPEGVTHIGAKTFYECDSLESVVFPQSLVSIGESAFEGCKSLNAIDLPDGVTQIGKGAFENCDFLQDVTLPKGLTEVSDSLFSSCNSLISVTLPDGITRIGSYAFNHCNALSDITLPNGLTHIGEYAFFSCSALKDIILPAGLTAIEPNTFSSCKALKQIAIPEGVVSIGKDAFSLCAALTKLELPTTLRTIGKNAFTYDQKLTHIYNPGGQVQLFSKQSNFFNETNSCIKLQAGFTPGEDIHHMPPEFLSNAVVCYLSSHDRYSADEQTRYDACIQKHANALLEFYVRNAMNKALPYLLKAVSFTPDELTAAAALSKNKKVQEMLAKAAN